MDLWKFKLLTQGTGIIHLKKLLAYFTCFRTNILRSGRVGGIISPYTRFASSAKYSMKLAP
jgi:hypothetical protein